MAWIHSRLAVPGSMMAQAPVQVIQATEAVGEADLIGAMATAGHPRFRFLTAIHKELQLCCVEQGSAAWRAAMREPFEDRAARPLVAVTFICEVEQRSAHRLERVRFSP